MINHLKGLEINSIYDFDNSFSINELLCKFWEKIEESINISNESIDILNWIKEEGLPDELRVLLNELVDDGTIEQMINVDKIEEVIQLVNTKYAEMLAKHNNELLPLTNKVNNTETSLNELENRVTNIETDFNDVIQNELTNIDSRITKLSNDIPQTYQPLNSNSLNTKSKSVVGAINEIKNFTDRDIKVDDNGYYSLPNGLIIQWGTSVLADVNFVSEFRINLPKRVNKILVPLVTLHDMTGQITFATSGCDANGFTVKLRSVEPAEGTVVGIGAIRMNWIALCIQ